MTGALRESAPELLIREVGPILRITLNRPSALNALSFAMVSELKSVLSSIDDRGYTAIVLDGAGDRGFCGGGDVKALHAMSDEHAAEFLSVEYDADLTISQLRTPVISVLSGITMGGGIGIGGHVRHRVVTETSRLAMPEARIGLAPDVGGSLLLARAPGYLGEYLGTTAQSMSAGDAIALGFADLFVHTSVVPSLLAMLEAGQDPEVALRHVSSAAPSSQLINERAWIDSCFGQDSVLDALNALEASAEPAAREALAQLRANSAISVAVSFWAVRMARADQDLATVLERDRRVMSRLMNQFDGREGIRALLVDKDLSPRWNPERIEDVTAEQLAMVLGQEVTGYLKGSRV